MVLQISRRGHTTAFALLSPSDSSHIRRMAKNPKNPKASRKTPKSKTPASKASRPDVQPIGPALAELLNPAINRGESGVGSSTGLQPPPDNSWDRRAGGEAAAHRARASTKGAGGEVAKRDAPNPPKHPPPPTSRASFARLGRKSRRASRLMHRASPHPRWFHGSTPAPDVLRPRRRSGDPRNYPAAAAIRFRSQARHRRD